MTLHFLNDVVNDIEPHKIYKYVIIASLNSEPACKLINREPGSRLLVSSLPGSALRAHVESLGKLCDVNKLLTALPGKLDIKRHSPSILYIYCLVSNMLYYGPIIFGLLAG